MYYLFLFALQVTRFTLVLYWLSLMRASVQSGGFHMTAPQSAALLGYTVLAAALIWLPKRRSWIWTQIAFGALSVGLLRVLFTGTDASLYGLAIWIAAFCYIWNEHRKRNAPPAAGSGVVPAQQIAPAVSTSNAPAQQRQEPAQPVYDFNENMRAPRYSFDHVVGMAETKKRLLAAAQDVIAGQGKPRNGVLLFGDPGNGKTLMAEALAGELQVPFFSIAYGDMASKWVNETPQKVKAAFQAARKQGIGVFFVDEIDSFLKSRDGNAHHMDKDLTNVMLTEIVALRGTKIVLIAATNMLDELDGAGIREGRFDFKVEVPPPDLPARQAILRRTIGDDLGFEALDADSIANLAERWEGFSASRLASLGPQLAEMKRDGDFTGKVTFELGMRAMRLLQGRKGKLPENVKGIDEILMPEQSRSALRDLAFKMENVYSLEKIGGRLPRGVIFIGPPGTGKTQGAMALAKASNWAFLKITGAQIISKPDAWDKIYREACDIRPAIVFLDEADGILRDRQYSNYGMLTEKILTTMDGAGGRVKDVLFIAATNHYDRIDSAAVRGGRFEEKIAFDVPGADDMAAYVQKAVKDLSEQWTIPDEVSEFLLAKVRGLSIADADAVIQKSVDAAAVRRLREGSADLREADVELGARSVLSE